ncbi:hypothetical protein OB919_13535 [Halobacteria archaeon AArc-curdl1]|uniref:Uncharacterized protein n=1 Tax=Natronosalvus hydrolyticus TaxID=2979988 RepID=A0AAP2Z935_9EURY|nr:hypothetical protein [Halobacteria archaeon AArc-curdl1]
MTRRNPSRCRSRDVVSPDAEVARHLWPHPKTGRVVADEDSSLGILTFDTESVLECPRREYLPGATIIPFVVGLENALAGALGGVLGE